MKIINKNEIHKRDWKSFIDWSTNGYFLFGDINFYSGFISINEDNKIEKNLVDFFIYNKFILKDRYFFDWPIWIKNIIGNDINSWLKNLFYSVFKEKEIFQDIILFLIDVKEYKESDVKDWEKEYLLIQEHWKFTHGLRENSIKNYNNWIVYINKHTHINLKGYK